MPSCRVRLASNSPLLVLEIPMAESPSPIENPAHSPQSLSGVTVGRFRIEDLLGKGGMGEVYSAEDTKLKRLLPSNAWRPRCGPIPSTATASWKKRNAHPASAMPM